MSVARRFRTFSTLGFCLATKAATARLMAPLVQVAMALSRIGTCFVLLLLGAAASNICSARCRLSAVSWGAACVSSASLGMACCMLSITSLLETVGAPFLASPACSASPLKIALMLPVCLDMGSASTSFKKAFANSVAAPALGIPASSSRSCSWLAACTGSSAAASAAACSGPTGAAPLSIASSASCMDCIAAASAPSAPGSDSSAGSASPESSSSAFSDSASSSAPAPRPACIRFMANAVDGDSIAIDAAPAMPPAPASMAPLKAPCGDRESGGRTTASVSVSWDSSGSLATLGSASVSPGLCATTAAS
mmetsp:Transcript_30373/g.78475  ORF Transcript_30373/g.78475 Transcript_30373/m.78475 type:complete len:310 (+) Transcript_30373:930-1859(+)